MNNAVLSFLRKPCTLLGSKSRWQILTNLQYIILLPQPYVSQYVAFYTHSRVGYPWLRTDSAIQFEQIGLGKF